MEPFFVSRRTVWWLLAGGGVTCATSAITVVGVELTEMVLIAGLAFIIGVALTAMQYFITYIVSTRRRR